MIKLRCFMKCVCFEAKRITPSKLLVEFPLINKYLILKANKGIELQ